MNKFNLLLAKARLIRHSITGSVSSSIMMQLVAQTSKF